MHSADARACALLFQQSVTERIPAKAVAIDVGCIPVHAGQDAAEH